MAGKVSARPTVNPMHRVYCRRRLGMGAYDLLRAMLWKRIVEDFGGNRRDGPAPEDRFSGATLHLIAGINRATCSEIAHETCQRRCISISRRSAAITRRRFWISCARPVRNQGNGSDFGAQADAGLLWRARCRGAT